MEQEPYFYYIVVAKIPSWSIKWDVFPIFLFKMVSILFSEPTGTFGLSKYEGDRVNPKLRVKCEWRSCLKTGFQTFFKWIHLSFTGPILQHYQRQIEDTGGKIVQPDKTSVIFSSWLKCDPMYTTWTSNLLKFSAFSRIALQNIFRNISYWNLPGNNFPSELICPV